MSKAIDLTGQKFGRLTVIEKEPPHEKNSGLKRKWKCICECGNEVLVKTESLTSGCTKSCGCLKEERDKTWSKTHGKSKTKLYKIWKAMRKRCRNQNNADYIHYGGRGIKVCEEWDNDYLAFEKWAISSGYADGLTIDRIDCDGSYSPENCRWLTMKEQSNNRTNNVRYEYNGESHSISEWADIVAIPYFTLYARLRKNGWPIEKALTT